jgi:hypothetical protein
LTFGVAGVRAVRRILDLDRHSAAQSKLIGDGRQALKEKCDVLDHTQSTYLRDCIKLMKSRAILADMDLAMARMHNATNASGYKAAHAYRAVDALLLDRSMLSEPWAVGAMSHLLVETYTRMTDAIDFVVKHV